VGDTDKWGDTDKTFTPGDWQPQWGKSPPSPW